MASRLRLPVLPTTHRRAGAEQLLVVAAAELDVIDRVLYDNERVQHKSRPGLAICAFGEVRALAGCDSDGLAVDRTDRPRYGRSRGAGRVR
jgi:hypothetical protein